MVYKILSLLPEKAVHRDSDYVDSKITIFDYLSDQENDIFMSERTFESED